MLQIRMMIYRNPERGFRLPDHGWLPIENGYPAFHHFPTGHPLYYETENYMLICPVCARENVVEHHGIHHKDFHLICEQCGELIE
jgi:uncharacterized protein YbaR (Trm112 family)